jgi:hypothetical protein
VQIGTNNLDSMNQKSVIHKHKNQDMINK